jgi:hypothetical protein
MAIKLFDIFTKFEAKAFNRLEHSQIAYNDNFNSLKIDKDFLLNVDKKKVRMWLSQSKSL